MAPKKVLITGVFGLIAGAVYQHLRTQPDRYDLYGLARRSQLSERAPKGADLGISEEKFILADLTDYNAIAQAVEGMDVVVQLAADPRPDASWESLLGSNIIGPRNVLEAARRAGVGRVVFASSIMVSWGYQQEDPYKAISEGRFDAVDTGQVQVVTHEWPHRPTGLYPATKIWGEALARYYADVHNMSVPCLRIGWVNAEDHPRDERGGPSGAVNATWYNSCSALSRPLRTCALIFFTECPTTAGVGSISTIRARFWAISPQIAQKRN